MTNNVNDDLRAQTERTNASSNKLENDMRTEAFTAAYLRVLDFHPEIRDFWDQIEFAQQMARNATLAAARSFVTCPMDVLSEVDPRGKDGKQYRRNRIKEFL